IRSFSSGRRGAYCALTSTSGIGGTASQSRGAAPADDRVREPGDEQDGDGDVDVAEVSVQAVVRATERPAGPGEAEAEGRAPEEGERQESDEGHARDARGDR